MKIIAIAAALLIATLGIAPQAVAGDPEAGRELGYTCLGCHGIAGYRNAYPSFRVPKLGGQTVEYMVLALKGYRAGQRKHPTMQGQAMSLSDQEIDDVSAYLAMAGESLTPADGSEAPVFEPAAACAACHGQNGISVNPVWPTLAGQHESYLEHSLNQYRNGERKNAVMAAQAAIIAEEDVARLARYFARLDGLTTIKPE